MNIFAHFEDLVRGAVGELQSSGDLDADLEVNGLVVEAPRDPSHGDLSTNVAMVLAKRAGKKPRDLAEKIVDRLLLCDDIAEADVAGPGFINLRVPASVWLTVLQSALDAGADFGRSTASAEKKVNVEYVSANPTGPLHVGHCRGAVFGDALANLLAFAGHDVTREYYINDAGNQIEVLARSVHLRYREALSREIDNIPEGLYPGEYLIPVGEKLAKQYGERYADAPDHEWLDTFKDFAISEMMELVRSDLALLNIHQEVFFSERTLHESGAISEMLEELRARDLVYDGRLPPPKGELPDDWEDREQVLFRSSGHGDDMDRPLVKSNGDFTYFAADVAYCRDKLRRGFRQLIYVLGADHGGYVKRLEAVCSALSDGQAKLTVRLCQLVKLFRGGEPVKNVEAGRQLHHAARGRRRGRLRPRAVHDALSQERRPARLRLC